MLSLQAASRKHNYNFRSPTLVDIALLVDNFSPSVSSAAGATVRDTIENLFINRPTSSFLKPVA